MSEYFLQTIAVFCYFIYYTDKLISFGKIFYDL